MLFTVCYAYATVMQWWRLRSLKLKLNGTLNPQNSLLVCSGSSIHDQRKHRCLENLLFKHDDRIACTVVPKPKVNLAHWIAFPKNLRCFPIHIDVNHHLRLEGSSSGTGGTIFILIQAVLDKYTKHHSDIVQIEDYGELMGWRASEGFELVLKTDIDHLTKLIHRFVGSSVDMNHELQILKIETVDVEGFATAIKYEKTYLQEQTLKYSYAPVHWNNFVAEIKELYGKLRDVTNPKIKIENGSPKCSEALDLTSKSSSSKKQDAKKANTLEVTAGGDHRRHKHSEHKSQQAKPEKKNQVVAKAAKASSSETPSTSKPKASSSKIEVVKTKSEINKKEEKPAREEVAKKVNSKKVVEEKTDVAVASTSKNGSSVPKAATTAPKKEQRKTKPSKVAASKAENGEVPKKPRLVKDKSVGGVGDMPSCTFSNLKNVKPPNVLVYSDSIVTKDNVKRVLYSILNKEKYTIYDLPTSSRHMSWDRSTVLVVVCGTVPPEMTSHLIQYLLNGGQLLCLCSDLMYSVLHTFTTAEVREHELVRFSYGSWESVKMMHHIFCYQASPAKKQFSKDSDQSNHSSNGSSPLAPRTPSNVELRHNEKDYNIQVQVLGTEETWQTPSLLLAKVKDSEGRAVFSQVHLEIDPDEYENDEAKYEFLKSSNQARLEILKDILSTHLDLVCDDNFGIVAYTPGYFLGRYDLKMNMLSGCENISENQMNADKISVVFCGNNVDPGIASNIRLPVLIHSCPSNFSTVDYFETLDTEHIGRLVIYTDIMTSSQHVFTKKLRHGLVVIPRQQTNGTGRSSNNWISPLGSANFSLQMHIPLNSPIGQSLSIIQHLVMVATVSAVRTIPGYEAVPLGIKWPNDLYANGKVKVGGLVVNSILFRDTAIVNVGCGVNLSNKNPTTCVNDVIAKSDGRLKPIPYEKFFAMVFNQLETLYDSVQSSNLDHLMDLYYQYWLHSDAEVSIQATEKGNPTKAKIIGIDNYGFLSVRLEDGTLTTVQPDGNSFDMMTGLIAPKLF